MDVARDLMVGTMMTQACGICKSEIDLQKQGGGLVFDDHWFVCEHCVDRTSEEELRDWSSKMIGSPGCGMPIALWLIHEHNKDMPLFTTKKR